MANNTPISDQVASIQESARQFVNDILGNLNQAAAEMAGVDVMWFRLKPDKRSQDVIFQSYTLYGVEDCPLQFRAIYSDQSYDDAAITYNIMGINFAIPMTLDIAVDSWKQATNNDGTIPQKGDIVFIPLSRKLMEVVSMQPVKTLGAQLTSYKVNLSIYTPTRNRIVGENLKESIEESTTNLMDRFKEEIHTDVKDIIDDNQLSIYTSTSQDKHKKVTPTKSDDSIMYKIDSIVSYDLNVDGHTVARNYYNANVASKTLVEYKVKDKFTSDDSRCLSCWFNIRDSKLNLTKNIKKEMIVSIEDGDYFIDTSVGTKFKKNSNVVIKRGLIVIPGVVVNNNRIKVNGDLIAKLNKHNPGWNRMPGFTLDSDNVVNLIGSDNFNVSIKGGIMISISTKDEETLIQMPTQFKLEDWYGIVLNMNDQFIVDIFTSVDGKLTNIIHIDDIENEIYDDIEVKKYYIKPSNAYITNIRLYNTSNTEIDKQLTDLVSYNIRNNSNAIINDSADTYLNKEYKGRQR